MLVRVSTLEVLFNQMVAADSRLIAATKRTAVLCGFIFYTCSGGWKLDWKCIKFESMPDIKYGIGIQHDHE
jgi:hypothetical protein